MELTVDPAGVGMPVGITANPARPAAMSDSDSRARFAAANSSAGPAPALSGIPVSMSASVVAGATTSVEAVTDDSVTDVLVSDVLVTDVLVSDVFCW